MSHGFWHVQQGVVEAQQPPQAEDFADQFYEHSNKEDQDSLHHVLVNGDPVVGGDSIQSLRDLFCLQASQSHLVPVSLHVMST